VALVATFDSRANALVLAPVGSAPDGPVPTLWILRRDGGVQRLGPMDMTKPTRIQVDPTLAAIARTSRGLAVSLEPVGVVSDKPKGPVIAAGDFATI
jgi:anti-sigma-K factor RskA